MFLDNVILCFILLIDVTPASPLIANKSSTNSETIDYCTIVKAMDTVHARVSVDSQRGESTRDQNLFMIRYFRPRERDWCAQEMFEMP